MRKSERKYRQYENREIYMNRVSYQLFHLRIHESWLSIPHESASECRTVRDRSRIPESLRGTATDWRLHHPGEYCTLRLFDCFDSYSRACESGSLRYIESHVGTIFPISLDEEHFFSSFCICESDHIHVSFDIFLIIFREAMRMGE